MPEWWEAFKAFIGRTEEGLQGQLGSAGTQIYDAFEDVRKQAKATINKLVPEPVASAAGRAGDRLAKVVESEKVKLGVEMAIPAIGGINRLIPTRAAVAKKFQQGPVRVEASTAEMSEKMARNVAAARKHTDKAFKAMDEVQYARFVDTEGLTAARQMKGAAAVQSEVDEADQMIRNFEKFLEADTKRIRQLGFDIQDVETMERVHRSPELMEGFIKSTRESALNRLQGSSTKVPRISSVELDELMSSRDVGSALGEFGARFTIEDIEDLLRSIRPR